MEIEVKQSKKLDDGKHKGIISRIEYKKYESKFAGQDFYEVAEIMILVPEESFELKYFCPLNLTEASKLGRLLTSLKVKLEVGKKIDLDKELINKAIEFMSINRKKGDKEYSEIVEDSIKSIL